MDRSRGRPKLTCVDGPIFMAPNTRWPQLRWRSLGMRAEHWVAIRPAWVRLELEQVQLEWEMLQEMVVMNRRRTLRQHGGYKNKIKIIKKTTADRCSKLTTAVAAAETAVAAKLGARPQSRPSCVMAAFPLCM